MNDIRNRIIQTFKKMIGESSFVLAVIYTLGHIVIAMICIRVITGAQMNLAAVDAIVEPMINGVWFYLLHKAYRAFTTNKLKESEFNYGY
jgi:uncharacterized membrane protein